MKRKLIYTARVFLFFIIWPQTGLAQIVINEIGAYETSEQEWVEIYNAGDTSVDLTGWKFWENATNHGLTAFQGDFVMEPHEYAIIANKADIFLADKSFSGTILDSSWSSLNTGGEEIGLKDSTGTAVEIFTYLSVPTTSLERKDPTLADYLSTNWQAHPSNHTAGAQNSNVTPPPAPEPTPEPEPETEPEPTPAPEETPVIEPPADETPTSTPEIQEPVFIPEATLGPGDVVINEFVSDPRDGEDEWVEIVNRTEREISLAGWTLEEGSGASTQLDVTLAPHGFYVIAKPKGSLNNSGDVIILKNSSGQIFDSVAYGSWVNSFAPVAADPNSVARQDSVFKVTNAPTPGAENIFVEVQTTEDNENPVAASATLTYSPSIVLNEVFPNPPDGQEEFIEIINLGSESVNLENWKLGDATTKRFIIKNVTLVPGQTKSFPRSVTNIALNNTGAEAVRLFWPNSQEANSVTYEDAPKNKSYILTDNGAWAWSDTATPDEKNIFVHVNEPPVIHWMCPKQAKVGEIISCDASDSTDDGDQALQFAWDFGNGRKDNGPTVRQIYSQTGSYVITLVVADSLGLTATTTQKISIKALPVEVSDEPEEISVAEEQNFPPLFISEFLPNPKGPDEPGEFIELFNPSDFAVDLTDWILDDNEGGSKPYIIPSDTTIEAKAYKLFSRDETHLSLNNTHDAVRLLTPAGVVMENAEYEKTSEGVSFIRNDQGQWVATSLPTPNEINAANFVAEKIQAQPLTIGAALELDPDTQVTIRGRLTALPETLGAHIAYLADESAGLQLYFFQSRWPKLALDNEIAVTGTVTSVRGEARLKITRAEDILVVGHATSTEPKLFTTASVSDIPPGTVAMFSGAVIEKKSDGFYVSDASGDIFVSLKPSLRVPVPPIDTQVSVTGIVLGSAEEPRLLVRSAADLKISQVLGTEHVEESHLAAPDQPRRFQPLFIMSALGVAGTYAVARFLRQKKSTE